jgi:hypothetical protein
MNNGYKQVSLLPWLNFSNIQIGDVIFWKYDSSTISDASINSYLDEYVKCYIDKHQNPITNIMIASYKDKNYFEYLSNEEYEDLNIARNILCFLCITEQSRIALINNNNSIGPASADIFEMVSQNFISGTDDIAVKSGSITSGGWKLNEIHFQEPWSTGGFFKNINAHVHKTFNKLLVSSENEDLKNRLTRSLEWFRLAHIENGTISPFFRIVMMATAYEILFDIPNTSNKAGFLADRIDQTIAEHGFEQETRRYGKNQEDQTRSRAAWWGWDFYKLRNSIVHGNNIPFTELIYSDWITHAIVADLLFYSYISYLLNEASLFDTEINIPDFSASYKLFNWTK